MKIFVTSKRICEGGAERMAVLMANGFIRQGYSVAVASSLSPKKDYILEEGIKKYNVHVVNDYGQKESSDFKIIKCLRKAIKDFNPDIIVGVMEEWTFRVWIASLGLNKKIISTDHNTFERPVSLPMTKRERFFKYYTNFLYPAVTVLTQRDADLLKNRFRRVIVMPNPISLPLAETVPPKEKVILAVGRIYDWFLKGYDILIKAFGAVSQHYPEWRLRIVGAANQDAISCLTKLANKCGVSDKLDIISFTNNIIDEYKRSAVFCLSSRNEGFGLVLIEAMSQGCACITTDDCGRQREIITTEEQGLCIERENEKALESALVRMLGDEKYRQLAQHKALKRAADFTMEQFMGRWEKVLKEAIGEA